MHHKENKTLNLLEQFTQKNQIQRNDTDDNEKMMFRELGQLMSNDNQRSTHSGNSMFGIPNFIWYLIIAGLFCYLLKEIFILNQIHDVSDVVSTITEGTHKVSEEIVEMQNSAHKAMENANAKKDGR